MRERCQHDAGPRDRTSPRDCSPAKPRRKPRASDPSTGDGEHDHCRRSRYAWPPRVRVAHAFAVAASPAAADAGDLRPEAGCSRPFLQHGLDADYGILIRIGAGAARNRAAHFRSIEGWPRRKVHKIPPHRIAQSADGLAGRGIAHAARGVGAHVDRYSDHNGSESRL